MSNGWIGPVVEILIVPDDLHTLKAEYNSTKFTMRFWNALVPIALVPVVTADIHFGPAGCWDKDGHQSGPTYLIFLPEKDGEPKSKTDFAPA
ncbi:uncharacterized protein EI90DRAFT_3134413 [Cantharellus anzutake]|uniref:uncharacterized protein n=1 Tax=Cantharellus anzutake TaxID=1750568 RepID=UPI001903B52F|nr:uncharacterized protein EI90DRAFT_3134413 [Cantharellus anzutake]KAF8316487.1 hypothetical protein EI90DRAFT_3134413 [Cantharellus anzutake]